MALDFQAHWRQESQVHTCLYSDFKEKFVKPGNVCMAGSNLLQGDPDGAIHEVLRVRLKIHW